jgi:hypothetical protein
LLQCWSHRYINIYPLHKHLRSSSQSGRPLRNIHISNDNGSFYTYYFLSSITYDTFMMGQGFFSSLFCWVGVGFCLFVFFAFDLCLMCTMLPVFLDYSVITVFTVFRLLTDFVCLHTYEFWLSLCKIVRSSVILLLSLLTVHSGLLSILDWHFGFL